MSLWRDPRALKKYDGAFLPRDKPPERALAASAGAAHSPPRVGSVLLMSQGSPDQFRRIQARRFASTKRLLIDNMCSTSA